MKSLVLFSRFLVFTLLFSVVAADLSAHEILPIRQGRWELLGQRKVNFRADRDVIYVTAQEGTFTALHLKIKRAPIDLTRVVIHYRNGDTQTLNVRQRVPAGGQSRVLDLPGNRRIITKVVFLYDTLNRARTRATVQLWGRH